MTDASPSPFRRFPWVQLVFCLACLAMTAWTWMRYSYAWEVTPSTLAMTEGRSMVGTLVWISGHADVSGNEEDWRGIHTWELRVSDGSHSVNVLIPGPETPKEEPVYVGRVSENEWAAVVGPKYLVDARASRFHPASVAGLVVGAMGCFIFGLYLRRWLRERDAPG